MTPLSSWVLCSKWFSPPKRFFDLQTVLYVGLTVSFRFFGKWLLLQKRFRAGFRQLCFTFISSVSSWGQSCVNCWHVSPIQIQSAENDPSCRGCWGILWAYSERFQLELCQEPIASICFFLSIVTLAGTLVIFLRSLICNHRRRNKRLKTLRGHQETIKTILKQEFEKLNTGASSSLAEKVEGS